MISDLKSKKTVAVIYGGVGEEHDVSLMGYKFLSELIDEEIYQKIYVEIERSGNWYIIEENEKVPTFPVKIKGESGFLKGDEIIHCDCAFPLLHGDFGEDGSVQGLLLCAGINFVGNGILSNSVCLDKGLTKLIANFLKIPTLRGFTAKYNEPLKEVKQRAEREIGYPMFIKPTSLGSSVGASPVLSESEFYLAYEDAKRKSKGSLLIEEFLDKKREIECGFFTASEKEFFSSPAEVLSRGFYGYEEKYSETSKTKTVLKADITNNLKEKIYEYSKLLVDSLGIKDIARIDFFVSENKIFFNEINTMPGFTKNSLYPNMFRDIGYTPSLIVNTLIGNCLERRSE